MTVDERPGAGGRLMITGLAGRLPVAMVPMTALLLTASATGSFAVAGAAVAAVGIGGALAGPLIGWSVDRWRPRRVTSVVTAVQLLALGLVLASVQNRAPTTLMLAAAALLGAANPALGSIARAAWSAIWRGSPDRTVKISRAMAWETTADEISFVIGPVLASTVFGVWGATTAVLVLAAVALIVQPAFVLLLPVSGAQAQPQPQPQPQKIRSPLTARAGLGLLALALPTAGVGVVFGSVQTGVAALLQLWDQAALTGAVYAGLGIGSAASGLAVMTRPGTHPARRVAVGGGCLAAAGLSLYLGTTSWRLALCCLGVGLCVSPVLASAYTLAERRMQPHLATTTMVALATSTTVGVAAGAAIAGALVDAYGPTAGWLLPVASGVLIMCVGLALTRLPRNALR